MPSKSWRQFWMYFYCVIFSLMLYGLAENFLFSFKLFFVLLLGLINSLAVFCNFRAVNASLSKTSALLPLTSVIAIIFGLIFLGKTEFLNIKLSIGALFAFFSAGLLLFGQQRGNKELTGKKFFRWIIGLSFIGGTVSFCMRYFALNGIGSAEFIFFWYFGSFLGSALLLIPARKSENFNKLNLKSHITVLLLALFIWLALILSYSASKLAPLTVTEPIFLIGQVFAPVIIGLFIFKEVKKISILETVAMIIGVIGGIIIASNY